MRTREHWDICKELHSYRTAHEIALQLREAATQEGLDSHGLKVLSKEEVDNHGYVADAQIHWEDGPENWVTGIQIQSKCGVCMEVQNNYVISFYDI